MAFFTPQFNYDTLADSWTKRKTEMRRQRLQPFADMLFKIIRDDILDRRADIHAELLDVTRAATTRAQLNVTLWSYNGVKFFTRVDNYQRLRYNLQEDGLLWTVHPEGQPRTSADIHSIVRHTDLCARLACLFDPAKFRVVPEVISHNSEVFSYVAATYALKLKFYPDGNMLPLHRDGNLAAAVKYAGVPDTGVRGAIYKGYVEPPSTPPPPPARTEPPMLERRLEMWQRNCARDPPRECPTKATYTRLGFSADDAPVCYCQVCDPDGSE